jgi:DNA-binding response OmpR family regulator
VAARPASLTGITLLVAAVPRTIRRDSPEMLLVILTGRSSEIDVIVGLDVGADNYLVKPFSLTVLLARLRAHLRQRPISAGTETVLQLGVLTIDLISRRCHIEGSDLALRPKEFDLLAALAATLAPPSAGSN